MGAKGFKLLLLLLIALIVYVEAAPGAVEQPNQPPKNETLPENKDDLPQVNLIFPRVESIDMVQCDDEKAKKEQFVNCTIDFRTRLVKYRILNYDFMNHTGKLVQVEKKHKNPSMQKGFVYIGGEEFTFPIMEQKATEWLANDKSDDYLWKREDMADFVVCDAYSKFFLINDGEYELCIHDTTITIRLSESKGLFASGAVLDLVDAPDFIAPITSAYVYLPTLEVDGSVTGKLTFHLFWTDAVGRMKISKLVAIKYSKPDEKGKEESAKLNRAENYPLNIAGNKIELVRELVNTTNYLELSSIPNPISKNFTLTWPKESNFLSKKRKLVGKFKADLEMKWRSDFIMAASPIYLSFSIKNTTNQSTTLEPKLDSMGLCFVRGYRMFETTENGLVTNFDCRQNGVSQNKFVELPKLQNSSLLVTHAYHVANVDGYRYIHLFYTLKHENIPIQNRYLFCAKQDEYSPNKNISSKLFSDMLLHPMPTLIADECVVKTDTDSKLLVSPSDIIAYHDGKVVKTIALWGLLYTVSEYNLMIEVHREQASVLEGIPFRINAAFSTGKTVYFFTHNNFIVIASMNMDADYQKLTVDFANAQEIFAEKFIFNNFLRAKGDTRTLEQPYLIGYHEYQKGHNDTVPASGAKFSARPVANGHSGKPGTEPGYDDFDPEPETKKSSTIWLIVIILVIAALILAALGYLFFMRGSGDQAAVEEPKPAAPRPTTRKTSPDPDLMVKTVRSQVKSVIR